MNERTVEQTNERMNQPFEGRKSADPGRRKGERVREEEPPTAEENKQQPTTTTTTHV